MAGYNRVVLVGNLTRDPEYKQLTSGQAICRLGLATNRQFKNRQTGSMVQEVCFIDIDVWGAQAESCKQYLQKGRSILVEGRIKFDTWEDQAGGTRSKHSIVADRIVFLSSSGAGADAEGEDRDAKGDMFTERGYPANEKEKELLDQIEQVKNRKKAKPSGGAVKYDGNTSSALNTGEISFKDEPPFQDDLPF